MIANKPRQARPHDIEEMHRVRMSVRENRLQSIVLTDDDYLRAIEPPGCGWVIEADARIVAFAVANGATGNVWALFVDPDYERRGFGRNLHDTMVEWLWGRGLERLWLTTAPGTRAERFYTAAGWRRRGVTASGETAFELTRSRSDAAGEAAPGDDAVSRHPMTLREVVLRLPGMDAVGVTRDVPYGEVPVSYRRMDVYRPADPAAEPLPAVVLVMGYSDVGGRKLLGCSLKDMASYIGWARLFAAVGIVAVTYETEEPVRDARALLDDVEARSAALGIDPTRLGIWSCSGNVPNALALLQPSTRIACAALCYGYMQDEDGFDDVARAAAQFGFANPAPARAAASLRDVPMLIVRAGGDETPGLNASLDRFVARALAEDAAVSVLNLPDAPHAFDVLDDSDRSRSAIRQILGFFTVHLLGRPG